jgi:hypothetical protein
MTTRLLQVNDTFRENRIAESLENINPGLIYTQYISNTKHPEFPAHSLAQIGSKISRWVRIEEVIKLATQIKDFERFKTQYLKNLNVCLASRPLWGDDGNVVDHPTILLGYVKQNPQYNDLFSDPTLAKIFEFAFLFHDIAELFLMENGLPRLCDHPSNTKTKEDRELESEILESVIMSLPKELDSIKSVIIGMCNKKGYLGDRLATAEKELFKISAEKCLVQIQKVKKQGYLTFINTKGEVQLIAGQALAKILEYNEKIALSCVNKLNLTDQSLIQTQLKDSRTKIGNLIIGNFGDNLNS